MMIKHILTFIMILFVIFMLMSCKNNSSDRLEEAAEENAVEQSYTTIVNQTVNEANIQETTSNKTRKAAVPRIGMSESEIQNTNLGIAALTNEEGGFWDGERHTFHHYTFYYRYETHTDIVYTVRTHNGIVDEVNDYRDAPITVSKDRHDSMIAAGVPVNYKH